MSEKTLQFNNIRLNKKEFHKSKEAIDLITVNVDQTNLTITTKVLSFLLVTKKVELLNHYVLLYLK